MCAQATYCAPYQAWWSASANVTVRIVEYSRTNWGWSCPIMVGETFSYFLKQLLPSQQSYQQVSNVGIISLLHTNRIISGDLLQRVHVQSRTARFKSIEHGGGNYMYRKEGGGEKVTRKRNSIAPLIRSIAQPRLLSNDSSDDFKCDAITG